MSATHFSLILDCDFHFPFTDLDPDLSWALPLQTSHLWKKHAEVPKVSIGSCSKYNVHCQPSSLRCSSDMKAFRRHISEYSSSQIIVLCISKSS